MVWTSLNNNRRNLFFYSCFSLTVFRGKLYEIAFENPWEICFKYSPACIRVKQRRLGVQTVICSQSYFPVPIKGRCYYLKLQVWVKVCDASLLEYSYLFAQQPSSLTSLKHFHHYFDWKIHRVLSCNRWYSLSLRCIYCNVFQARMVVYYHLNILWGSTFSFPLRGMINTPYCLIPWKLR